MSLRTVGKNVLLTFLALLLLGLFIGSILGQPVFVSYVETGSMSPTLDSGDGFVAVPTPFAGPIQEGDIIVFEAEKVQGGGLTTHRVVSETERGYITRGDANPFADQNGEEPPVKEAQVVAVAWQPGGSVLVVPHFGTAVVAVQSVLAAVQQFLANVLGTRALLGPRGLAYLFFALALVWYAVGEWRTRTTRDDRRDSSRDRGTSVHLVVGAFTVLLVAGATLPMAVPAGAQEYGVVSAEFDSESPTVIPVGQSNTLGQPLANGGVLPVVVYLEPASEGVEVEPHRTQLGSGEAVNATVTLHAPDRTGYYRRFVAQHRYLAVLPEPVIRALYQLHPWAPIVVINALIAVPFYVFGVAVLGSGQVRNRSRDRGLPVRARLRKALRSLY
jgi:signal peptidase